MTHPISTDEPPGSAWLRTVGAAALLMVCYLALSTAAFYVSAVGGSVTLAGGVAAVVVGGVLGVVAVRMAMALDATPPRLRAVMSGTNRSRRAIVPLLVAAIVIVAVVPMLVVVAERLGARGTTALPLRREPAGWDLALAFVAIALAPWMEEISVRGLLFTGLQRRFGFWPAAAASGFVWAALHRAPAVLVAFTVAGVALAWVRRRTGSVRAGVALHATWNVVASVAVVGWGPALAAAAVVVVSLVVTRRGWPRPVAAAVPAFRRRLRRGVGGAGRGIPLRTAPGDRTTLAAGVCMTAGFAAEAAGRYRVGGGSAEPVGLALVGLAAGLLGVIAALSRHRRRVAPAAAAAGLAGGILGLVARGAYVAGWHGMIPLDALSDLMIAWWLWSVAVAARRPPVSTGAGVAAVGLMLAVVPLTPSGAGDLAWTFAMALTASAGVCLLAVALIGRPVLRLPRAGLRIAHAVTSLRLSGRRSAVVATVAAALVSVGVFSIPPPAAGGTRIATCVPRVVHVRTALAATRATVHGRVTLSAARACRPRGRVVVRVRLTAAGGRRLAPSLAGLSPRVTWIGVIGPGGSATVFSRARTDWCRRARFPAVVTLTVSIRGGRSGSSGAAVCGHAAAGTST